MLGLDILNGLSQQHWLIIGLAFLLGYLLRVKRVNLPLFPKVQAPEAAPVKAPAPVVPAPATPGGDAGHVVMQLDTALEAAAGQVATAEQLKAKVDAAAGRLAPPRSPAPPAP